MNYYKLLKIKVHYNYLIWVIFLILLIAINLANYTSCYDTYTTYAVYNNGYLEVNTILENSDAVDNAIYFKYQNEKYQYHIKNISSLNVVNNQNYQIYQLKIKKEFKQNKIIKVTFFYNKEKIIKKIFKIIF